MNSLHPGHMTAAERLAEIAGILADGLMRLTLLAPDIVEAILGGRQPTEMTLAVLMRPFPVGWREQARFSGADSRGR
jgi:hypothetical protein